MGSSQASAAEGGGTLHTWLSFCDRSSIDMGWRPSEMNLAPVAVTDSLTS